MRGASYHPQLAQLERFGSVSLRRSGLPLMRWLHRQLRRPPAVDGVEVSELDAGPVRVRLLRPLTKPVAGAVLWIHGGGLVLGEPAQNDDAAAALARGLGVAVASVHYRLAPEHPFPAALDDCLAAWRWLQGPGAEVVGAEADRLAIGGQSAGGGLAACLAQRLVDEGGPQPRAQVLVYPMLDDRTAARTDLDRVPIPVWNNRSNRTGWSCYLGAHFGREPPPYAVAARRQDLSGLPPAWIGVGSLDLFFEEDRHYARRLRRAGVPCTLELVAGAPHGFPRLAADREVVRAFVASQHAFLRSHLFDGGSR